jgi:hypothetical protein
VKLVKLTKLYKFKHVLNFGLTLKTLKFFLKYCKLLKLLKVSRRYKPVAFCSKCRLLRVAGLHIPTDCIFGHVGHFFKKQIAAEAAEMAEKNALGSGSRVQS